MLQADSRQRRREHRADHRPAGPANPAQPGRNSPATASRPRPCSTWSSRSAASRWAKWSKGSCASRWSCACRRTCAASPEAIGAILMPTPSGRAHSAVAAGRRRSRRRAVHDHARMGPAADHGHRPTSAAATWAASSPRPGRRSPTKVHAAAGPLSRRVGRPVREPAAGPDAAADRRAAGAGADLRAALPDLPQRRRRPARVHRRAVRLGRRHLRPVAARHAVFDLGGDRLHRPVGRGGARRHDPGLLHPATAQTRACRWTRPSTRPPSRACGPC